MFLLSRLALQVSVLLGSFVWQGDAHGFGGAAIVDEIAAGQDVSTSDPTFLGDFPPSVALASNGTAVVVWSSFDFVGVGSTDDDFEVLYSRSTDFGRTWTPAQFIYGSASAGAGGLPSIATDGAGTWMTIWFADGLHVTRSTDDGVTWGAPVSIFDENSSAYHSWSIASDSGGTWVATASYDGGSDGEIFFVRSFDAGETWTSTATVLASASNDVTGDTKAQVAGDGTGGWVMVWSRGNAPVAAVSSDNGDTWSAPVPLGMAEFSGAVTPSVDTDREGTWLATWSAGGLPGPDGGHDRMLFARSTDNGLTWSSATTLVQERNDTGPASSTAIRFVGESAWVAMWETPSSYGGTIGSDPDLLHARSSDNGLSWTTPSLVNNFGRVDDGRIDWAFTYSGSGALATDRNGTVLAAWTTNYNLNGTKGDDYDIVYAALRRDCPEQPRMDCVAPSRPGRSRLVIRDGSGGNDKLTWKWMDGDAALEDFGDPTLDASYSLCLYATVLGSTRLVFEEDAPAGAQAWTPKDGFTFEDTVGTHGSIRTLVLRPGEEGRAAISARLSGPSTGLPALPLDFASPVQVQLVNDETSACWGARFPTAVTNDPSRVKARSE